MTKNGMRKRRRIGMKKCPILQYIIRIRMMIQKEKQTALSNQGWVG